MDVFALHGRLIEDYQQFTRSFVDIHDERIAKTVNDAVEDGLLWPEPWIQVNPNFQPGATPDELVDQKALHPECARIFRVKSGHGDVGRGLRFHQHQTDAIHAARTGANYVLTTGTGSGKSLAYIAPIVDRVLRDGPGKGLRALVVYPMNALANSQAIELEKFISFGYPKGQAPLRYARYTGQESDDEREAILTDPPDIVLTNYVMLELILTRPRERKRLVGAAHGNLQFLVLDELHTYRGRQGADVAMLVRRVREACAAPSLQIVGTSATMASGGSRVEERREVAAVAGRLFGAEVLSEHVIGETLRRATPTLDLDDPAVHQALRDRVASPEPPPTDAPAYLADPLSSWIETTFGLTTDPDTGELVRGAPRAISGPDGIAGGLSALTGEPPARCAEAIERHLLTGYRALDASTGRPAFAFRVHQFLTKGDTAYATLEPEETRYVTVQGQTYKPGDRARVLLPLAFCRECGQEYYTVNRRHDGTLEPRDIGDRNAATGEDDTPGFLFIDGDRPWPAELGAVLDRVPESWLVDEGGHVRIDPNRRRDLPRNVAVDPSGHVEVQTTGDAAPHDHGQNGAVAMTWLPAPFRFCLNCASPTTRRCART